MIFIIIAIAVNVWRMYLQPNKFYKPGKPYYYGEANKPSWYDLYRTTGRFK